MSAGYSILSQVLHLDQTVGPSVGGKRTYGAPELIVAMASEAWFQNALISASVWVLGFIYCLYQLSLHIRSSVRRLAVFAYALDMPCQVSPVPVPHEDQNNALFGS